MLWLLILFCRVSQFLATYFRTIASLGIGLRQYRDVAMGSLVADVTLVSKLQQEPGFNKIALNLDFVELFETNVFVFPEPDWTSCSFIQNQNDCTQFNMNMNEINLRCGWCSLLSSCMQGMFSCIFGRQIFSNSILKQEIRAALFHHRHARDNIGTHQVKISV